MARAYKYITKFTSPNQNARNSKITGITIHWWGTPVGQSASGIVSWLCDKRAGTSAHYVVSEGTVWCIVDPDRRAWHAGNSRANHTQIGIELDPNQSRRASTERTAAALIADLRAVYGDLPLSPHRRWTSTACPGNWDLGALDRLARGTSAGVPAVPAGGASKPVVKPSKPAKPAVKPNGKLVVDDRFGSATVRALQEFLNGGSPRRGGEKLVVDGKAGPKTWRALQHYLGTPVDDEVSNQSYRPSELGNGITGGWDYDGRGAAGSTMVRALQRWIGVKDDGVWGPKTSGALQRKLNQHA